MTRNLAEAALGEATLPPALFGRSIVLVGLMGAGKIDFKAVVDALAAIGFEQWANLETSAPSGSIENDMTTNLGFIRGLIAARR